MFVRRPRGTTAAARRSGAQPGTDDQRPQEGNQHPATQFFTGWMPFLPPNQQYQSSTEDNPHLYKSRIFLQHFISLT